MLRSFRDKDTERVWRRQRVRKLGDATQRAALRKLLILDAAETLGDLRVPPGNRLEKLRGDRVGRYSVRVNEQWRICLRWSDGGSGGRGDSRLPLRRRHGYERGLRADPPGRGA